MTALSLSLPLLVVEHGRHPAQKFNRNIKKIWEYLMERKILLTGEHIPSLSNQTTHWET